MRVWLVTIGEPLPTDGAGDRLHRTGLFAETLAAAGHDVTWWTSTFDHARKRHRADEDRTVPLADNYRIRMMRSRGYGRNVSLGRVLDHRGLARKFARLAPSAPQPEIVVAAMPTPGLSLASAEYGRARGVPVVLDMRDMWPDIFVRVAPAFARPLAGLALGPMKRTLSAACARATAIIGITRPFVEWGLRYAGRPGGDLDRDFPLGYSQRAPSDEAIRQARQFWAGLGLPGAEPGCIACFFGYMGRQFELETVIDAARILHGRGERFTFVLCGTGDNLPALKNRAKGLDSVIFPGWVGYSQIWTLMRMASVGLAPYLPNEDFAASIPNKAIEYFSAGLPVVSSLQGVLQNLLAETHAGVTYENARPEDLASALHSLRDDPNRLHQMSANARALFEERFVAEKVYGEMTGYLENVIAADRADSPA